MLNEMVYDPYFPTRLGLITYVYNNIAEVRFSDGNMIKISCNQLQLVERLRGVNKNGNLHVTQ